MADLDRQQVAAARLWAASRQPYLATALFGLPTIARPGIGTIAVDDRWRLSVDPEVASGFDVAELGRVLVHLVGHLLRDHAGRVTTPVPEAWLLAVDAEVNDDLAADGLVPGAAPDRPWDFGRPPGALAEAYLGHLIANPARRRGWLDCGSGADGCRRPWEGEGGLSSRECRLVRATVAQAVCAHAGRIPGSVAGGWLRWAHAVLRPQVDWRQVLRAEIRRAVASVTGAVDYTYRRPSRRASSVDDVVMPALHRPSPEIVVVCDTSGSMHDELLSRALAEVEGLVQSQGLGRHLRVLAVDAQVQARSRVRRAAQVTLAGGGGTDMGAGVAAAAALRPKPDVIVVLTDGYTPWPDRPPSARVVVGLLDQGQSPGVGWEPPKWARTVRISLPGAPPHAVPARVGPRSSA